MNILAVITAVLTLMAGIGVFLIACTMMSSNLESASSKRLKRLFAKTGDNSDRHHPVFVRHDLYRHHHGRHGVGNARPGHLPHDG